MTAQHASLNELVAMGYNPPRPRNFRATRRLVCLLLGGALAGLGGATASAQVSPAEILNPQLRALEETYLPQLMSLNRALRTMKFPFPFVLSRYVGVDPDKQAEVDSRGLEFVRFHDRVVLKVTGNYNAAYNPDLLTPNQRASRTFEDVIVPLLGLLTREIPADAGCDAIGFEVSYHTRRRTRASDFEGKEILVVVLDRSDAFGFLSRPEQERQEVLNHSEIYLNGGDFGLALGQAEPFNVESLARSVPRQALSPPAASASDRSAGTRQKYGGLRGNQDLPPGLRAPGTPTPPAGTEKPDSPAATPATAADAERLQAKYQSQLEALAKAGVAGIEFVDYAPPSFAVFRGQAVLQFTIRNPLSFQKDTSSIYKRAAQSFDLFLAGQLKALLEKIPADEEIQGLDITLLNKLAVTPGSSPSRTPSEAVEFICPLKPLRQFVEAEITNQDLINQSVVLVNGVRIALNLQQVE